VRDLRAQEFLRELVVGVAVSGDFAGSILVEILHSVEGGDVEQVCSNLEINLPCLRLLISLSLLSLYLACLYCSYPYMLDIPLCFKYIFIWDCLLTLVFNQESHSAPQLLI